MLRTHLLAPACGTDTGASLTTSSCLHEDTEKEQMLVVCGSAMHGLESFASAASRRLRSCWLVGEPSCGHASKHRTAQLAAAAPGRNHDNRITPAFAWQGMVATLVITLPSTYEVSWST